MEAEQQMETNREFTIDAVGRLPYDGRTQDTMIASPAGHAIAPHQCEGERTRTTS
jgi:hypothetical protein